jgi:hypothetical protein
VRASRSTQVGTDHEEQKKQQKREANYHLVVDVLALDPCRDGHEDGDEVGVLVEVVFLHD